MSRQNPTVSLSHAWDRPFLPTGGVEKAYLLIELRATGPIQIDRAPINLSLVLDRSGSMAGHPLAFSKKACQFVIDQMNAGDMISLVAFDDEVRSVVSPAKVTNKEVLKRRIDCIQPGGSTNLSGGLLEGVQHVRTNIQERTVNRVILLSDGHANHGITDKNKLSAIAKEYRSSGVGITTMGVGSGFDEEMMEAISEHGGGNFYYIDTPDRIPSIFQEELQGLLSVVAQNMKLTLRTTGLAKVKGIYGYETEVVSGEHIVHLGDFYHDEIKTILMELELCPHTQGTHPVLKLSMDYADVTEGAAACSFSCGIDADFTNDMKLLGLERNAEVQKHVELTESAKVIEAAMDALDSGDLTAGRQMLQEQADHMLKASEMLAAPVLAAESDKLFSQLENFEYSTQTRKQLHEQKYRQLKRKT